MHRTDYHPREGAVLHSVTGVSRSHRSTINWVTMSQQQQRSSLQGLLPNSITIRRKSSTQEARTSAQEGLLKDIPESPKMEEDGQAPANGGGGQPVSTLPPPALLPLDSADPPPSLSSAHVDTPLGKAADILQAGSKSYDLYTLEELINKKARVTSGFCLML